MNLIESRHFTFTVKILPPDCAKATLTCPSISLDYEIFYPALDYTFTEILDSVTTLVQAHETFYCSPKSYVLQKGLEAYLTLDDPNLTLSVYSVDNTLSETSVTALIDVTLDVGELTEVTLVQTCPVDVSLLCLVATVSYTPVTGGCDSSDGSGICVPATGTVLSFEIAFTTPNPTLTLPLKTEFT